jgi:outer membrane protein OmpA-like peptidoglycan-associated protein
LIRRLSILAVLLVAGCASPPPKVGRTERVVLLPAADGHRSALLVTTAQGEMLMTEPLSVVEEQDGKIVSRTLAAGEVVQRYAAVIKALPAPPRVFTVYFYFDRTALLPESRALLKQIKADAERYPAAEIVLIGHTDRVGAIPFNDGLSLRRAQVVRDDFLSIGVPPSAIRVEGRGEREPMVPTEDEVSEPRNRRVVIKLR